jgi:hypothetical protein
LQYDDQWQCELLTIGIDECEPEIGTRVFVQCSEEELESARCLFIKFNPMPVVSRVSGGNGFKAEILRAPGIIFVNGLAVCKIDAIFGYNFFDKALVNRDRSAIGHDLIRNRVGTVLSLVTNEEVIKTMLHKAVETEFGSLVEIHNACFTPRFNPWRKIMKEMFGDRVCLSDTYNPRINLVAMEHNWNVLRMAPNLRMNLTNVIPSASDAIKEDGNKTIFLKDLSVNERAILEEGKAIAGEVAKEVGLNTYPVRVFVDQTPETDRRFEHYGFYESDGEFVGIAKNVLAKNEVFDVVEVLLHEYTHGTYGHDDNSREFENDLGHVMATLAICWLRKRNSEARYGLNYSLGKVKGG